jgi:hypothetical protein
MRELRRIIAMPSILIFFTFFSLFGAAQESTNAPNQEPQQSAESGLQLVVPPGTSIPIVLTAFLNTKSSQVGDKFYADTVYPVWIQQRLAIPRGSVIKGTVTEVVRPGKIKGKGRMAIRFDSITLPNGISRDLVAGFRGIHGPGDEKIDRNKETIDMAGSRGEDAGQVIGYSGQGAIIGAISGGGKGAGIGAGAGAAVGLVMMLFTRGRDLILEPGTQFDIELKQPIRFAYGELDFTPQQTNAASRSYEAGRPRSNRNQHDHTPAYPIRRGFPIPFGFPWP